MSLSKIVLQTVTGSVYYIRQVGVNWFVRGENIVSDTSKDISDREWPTHKPSPWPPKKGLPIKFFSIHFSDHKHKDRMPGGGKITSPVKKWQGDL
jgi:hypothetical protein